MPEAALLLVSTGVLGDLLSAGVPEAGQSHCMYVVGAKGFLIPGNPPSSEVKGLSHSLMVVAPFAHTCGLLISMPFMSTSVNPRDSWQPLYTEHNSPAGCCFQPLAVVISGKLGC